MSFPSCHNRCLSTYYIQDSREHSSEQGVSASILVEDTGDQQANPRIDKTVCTGEKAKTEIHRGCLGAA